LAIEAAIVIQPCIIQTTAGDIWPWVLVPPAGLVIPLHGKALQYGSTMRILVIGITVLIVILGRLSVMRQREGCGCWMSLLSSW
jgi:hypothetical protein